MWLIHVNTKEGIRRRYIVTPQTWTSIRVLVRSRKGYGAKVAGTHVEVCRSTTSIRSCKQGRPGTELKRCTIHDLLKYVDGWAYTTKWKSFIQDTVCSAQQIMVGT